MKDNINKDPANTNAEKLKTGIFGKIAQEYLDIETLESRNRDELDFHESHIGRIKAALEAAFTAGHIAALQAQDKMMRSGGSYMAAIEASYQDLVDFFGEPAAGDGFKTEAEWRVIIAGDQSVKIYNYKSSKSYNPKNPVIEDVTTWHIGGKNPLLVDKLVRMMAGTAKIIHKQGE